MNIAQDTAKAPMEASNAFKKLGIAINMDEKCKHGLWVGAECKECSKECRDEFFKNSIKERTL